MKYIIGITLILLILITSPPTLVASDAFTHCMVSAGIAHKLGGGALVSILAGIVSHIPLDMIPHYELSGTLDYVIDGALTIGGVYLLYKKFDDPRILWGALGGFLPDAQDVLEKVGIGDDSQEIFPTHTGLIRHGDPLPPVPGITIAIGINCISLVIFF